MDCALVAACGLGDAGRCVDEPAWFEVDQAEGAPTGIRLVAEPSGLAPGTWFTAAGPPGDCAATLVLSFEIPEPAAAPTTEVSPTAEVGS